MKKINQFFDKFFNYIPGYIFGLLTFLIGFFGSLIAILLSPEYVMWRNSISYLGIKTGGMYLRIGFIIMGIMSIPFMIYLGRTLKNENTSNYLRKIAIGAGIFSSICASLTGVFSGVKGIIDFLHGVFAFFSWISAAVFCSLFSVWMLKDSRFSKFQIYYGFVVGAMFVFYLIPFFITIYCAIYATICYEFGATVYLIMPTLEWIMNYSILFWYLYNSSYIWYKKI